MHLSRSSFIVMAPYTKRIGFAVFCRGDLVDFGIKTFRSPRTNKSISEETAKECRKLIAEFEPRFLIVKSISDWQKGSDHQHAVSLTIRKVAVASGVRTKEASFETAEQLLTSSVRPTKRVAFEKLQNRFPELARYVSFQNRSQSEYYTTVLSAITIGATLIASDDRFQDKQ